MRTLPLQPDADDAVWRAGIERALSQGAGVMNVILVRPEGLGEVAALAGRGDATAAGLCQGITVFTRIILRSTRRNPSCCSCCSRRIRKIDGVTFGFVTPDNDSGTAAIVFAVCQDCSAAPGELMPRVMKGLGDLLPGIRPIVVTHPEGGRA